MNTLFLSLCLTVKAERFTYGKHWKHGALLVGKGSALRLEGRTSLLEVHTNPTSSSCPVSWSPDLKEWQGWGMPLLSGTPPSPACYNGLEIGTHKHEWIFLPLSRSARRQQRLRGTQETRLPYLTTLVRWRQVRICYTQHWQHPEWPERQSSWRVHEGKLQIGFTEVESAPLNVGIAIPRAGFRPEWKDMNRVPSLQLSDSWLQMLGTENKTNKKYRLQP